MGSRDCDLDRRVLHHGDETERVEREVLRAALGFDEELGIGSLTVVDVGEGNGLVEVQQGTDGDLVPGWIFDGVVVDDGVAAVDAGAGGRGIGRDVIDVGRTGDVGLHLVVDHVDAGHQRDGEQEVGEGAGEGDEDALPAGMVLQLAGVVALGLARHLAGHLDVAAERKQAETIVGVAAFEAEESGAEADGEDFDADAAELGDGEVTEFMH